MSGLATFRGSSTSHQRLYIRTLLRDLGLPTEHVTLQHRRVFEGAQLAADVHAGRKLDDVLTELSRSQASVLIDALKNNGARSAMP